MKTSVLTPSPRPGEGGREGARPRLEERERERAGRRDAAEAAVTDGRGDAIAKPGLRPGPAPQRRDVRELSVLLHAQLPRGVFQNTDRREYPLHRNKRLPSCNLNAF